jgi:RNA polymerase sigma-70 factor, ECF subfamily
VGKNANEYRLVLLAQAGDRNAFNDLFLLVQEKLYRYINHITQDKVMSDDLFQEVLITVFKNIRWLREPEFFRSWMYRIATRAAFKALKKKKRFKETSLEELGELKKHLPDAEAQIILKETLESVSSVISDLSPASRSVLSLHYLEEMSLKEISSLVDIPIGTVKSRLAYGILKLREKMKKEIKSSSVNG